MKKVRFTQQDQKSKKVEMEVPFVVTYDPLLNKLSSLIHRNLYLLYMNQEIKNVFTPKPIVLFRSARKISGYLVRAKLYPLEREAGSEKCGQSRCEVCLNIEKTDTFTSTKTGESFKINHNGFLGNISITLKVKTDGKDTKRRENYWMRTLKT